MPQGYALPGGVGSGVGSIDPVGSDYFEEHPQSAYMDWMAELGLLGMDPMAQFARGRYGDYYDLFKANLGRDFVGRAQDADPNLRWINFMRTQSPQNEWSMLGPQERGANTRSQVPRLRWLLSVL